jgi:D-beta-D-heptose 7-phosphate kinase/D-beta-D-heptose 1-phosphate adenosyltransferase
MEKIKKILIIGEKCQDVFHYGNVDRLSPEAPIPILTDIESITNDGMAKNVYNNIKRMNEVYKKDFEINIISTTYSAKKERYVDRKSNHYFLRVDEPNDYETFEFNRRNLSFIGKADYIIISDYDKGYLLPPHIQEICIHKKKDCKVFLDTKKTLDPYNYEKIDFFKMNNEEWSKNVNAIEEVMKKITPKVIVTHGSMGAVFKGKHYKTNKIISMDVSGAGDTFLAGLVFEYAQSQDIDKSIIFANEMANIVVSKKGVSII